MKKLARNWLSFARLDLEAADKLRRDPEMTGIAAFHCQQCAEKSLKAIIAQNDLTVPRTHDLITLYAQVSEVASSVSLGEETLRQIDEAYIETRYPTDTATEAGPRISVDRAERFVAESRRIYEQARKLISETWAAGIRTITTASSKLKPVVILPQLDLGVTAGAEIDFNRQQKVPRMDGTPGHADSTRAIDSRSTWPGFTAESHIRVVDIVRTKSAHRSVVFDFDERTDELLIGSRGVSFLDAITAIEEHGVLLDSAHPNTAKYPNQHILVVNIGGYAYCVPYECNGETLLLKTVYPSRKFKYLIEGEGYD